MMLHLVYVARACGAGVTVASGQQCSVVWGPFAVNGLRTEKAKQGEKHVKRKRKKLKNRKKAKVIIALGVSSVRL